MKNKALFLDRDGVINKEVNYLFRIIDFKFNKGIFKICKEYISRGFIIIVITNQAGIARGFYDIKDFYNITDWMIAEFERRKIKIHKVYFCPHHPEFTGNCDCRKPKPGLIKKAVKDFNIDLKKSVLIGDKDTDIQAGINSGIETNFLIRTNKLSDLKKKNLKTIKKN